MPQNLLTLGPDHWRDPTAPLGRNTTYAYDRMDNLTGQTDRDGRKRSERRWRQRSRRCLRDNGLRGGPAIRQAVTVT